jgi:probable F420-dependent oxidoreductase
MTTDIGRIGVWTGALDAHPSPRAWEACRELEQMGFDTLWIPEAVGREPFAAAAGYLAATTTLKLATGIANIYARDAMTMAAAQKTLAEAYPGRFLLGLGVSHLHLVQHVRKHTYDKPLAYMKDYLAAMDKARFFAVTPEEDPGRVLAALGPKMLEVAATQAQGAHPYFTTPEHTARARDTMGADALLAPEQMVVLETEPTKAREVARAGMAVYLNLPNYANNLRRLGFGDQDFAEGGSNRLVDAIVAWGDVDAARTRVAEHFEAGADHVCVQVLRADRELPLDDWRRLAEALR